MNAQLAGALSSAVAQLAVAGVPSPRVDAELLAAYVIGLSRSRLAVAGAFTAGQRDRFAELVARRAARVPLQHLLGSAPMGPIEIAVGPGVFVPRLETELLLEWGLTAVAGLATPLVVDLCTGSGALAAAVAASRPDARVAAVELDPRALTWAKRNLPERVKLLAGDVTDPGLLPELHGRVDLVLANPPYVPEGTRLAPEAGHDPRRAVFAGLDGLAVIRPLAALAVRLLGPGGSLAIEHDASHAEAAPLVLAGHPELTDIVEHHDLADRPRFVTARRLPAMATGAARGGTGDGP